MSHLHLENGHTVSDSKEMMMYAREYYQKLYTPDPIDSTAQDILLSDLTQLSHDHSEECDRDISYGEVSCAVTQLSNNKAPGLDGLPAEFYKAFWDLIGRDFYSVLMYSLEIGILPLSCRRVVITLIPKQGDNGYLKNWRPVSLLCSDSKIFTIYYSR